MAVGAAAAVIVGTAVQAYGQYKSSKAQAEAMNAQASAKQKQAFELLDRVEINIEDFKKNTEKLKAQQVAAFAKGGVDVGEGTPLDVLAETNRLMVEDIQKQRREAEFKAEQLFRGADIDTQLSGDIRKAGKYEVAGTLLSGVASLGAK